MVFRTSRTAHSFSATGPTGGDKSCPGGHSEFPQAVIAAAAAAGGPLPYGSDQGQTGQALPPARLALRSPRGSVRQAVAWRMLSSLVRMVRGSQASRHGGRDGRSRRRTTAATGLAMAAREAIINVFEGP
jgi:hypothetical protein